MLAEDRRWDSTLAPPLPRHLSKPFAGGSPSLNIWKRRAQQHPTAARCELHELLDKLYTMMLERARQNLQCADGQHQAVQLAAPANCGANATSVANFCRVTFDGPSNGKQWARWVWPIPILV